MVALEVLPVHARHQSHLVGQRAHAEVARQVESPPVTKECASADYEKVTTISGKALMGAAGRAGSACKSAAIRRC